MQARDPGLDPTNITDDPSLDEVEDITPNVEPIIDVPVLPAVAPTVSFASDLQGGFRFGLSQLASMLSPTRRTVPTTTAEMPQPAFSKKSPVLAKPRPLPLGLTPSPGVSPISTGEPSVVLTLQAALAAQQSQLDQVLNKLAIQQARLTPTIADTITETVNLSALTAQAALSSQALMELLKRTSVSSSPGDHGNSSESSDSSSSSDDSSTSVIHNASKKKPKKQSSRKVLVERKQKLYQCLLKNAKTVRDDQTSFKRLAQNSDPKVCRTTYNGWIKQIKKCWQMLPKFDTLFDPADPSFIGYISKPYAN